MIRMSFSAILKDKVDDFFAKQIKKMWERFSEEMQRTT